MRLGRDRMKAGEGVSGEGSGDAPTEPACCRTLTACSQPRGNEDVLDTGHPAGVLAVSTRRDGNYEPRVSSPLVSCGESPPCCSPSSPTRGTEQQHLSKSQQARQQEFLLPWQLLLEDPQLSTRAGSSSPKTRPSGRHQGSPSVRQLR